MWQKKVFQRFNSIWSILGNWRDFKPFFKRKHFSSCSPLSLGFTLVELLVVIGILSILIAGVLITLNPFSQFQKAKDAARKSDLFQIQKALEVYSQDNGRYPVSSSSSPTLRIVRLDGTTADWGQNWQPYITTLPKDSTSSKHYVYYSSSTGQSYWLYASLDRPNDPQLCNSNADECSSIATNLIPANSCGGKCNYGVSSSNVSP